MHSMQGYADAWIVCEESCGQCISMQGYADAWILCEESCGQCIVCKRYACRERSGSVCNYEENTVSNDDENDGFRRAHESRRALSPAGPRMTAVTVSRL